MAAPTLQPKLIADLESAAIAMSMDRNPKGVTIRELVEFSGHHREQFDGVVRNVIKAGKSDLLIRIRDALAKVNIESSTVNDGLKTLGEKPMEAAEELKLARSLPDSGLMAGKPRQVVKRHPAPVAVEDNADVIMQGQISIDMRQFPKQVQVRMLNAVREMNGLDEYDDE